jgi:hypothetical protein
LLLEASYTLIKETLLGTYGKTKWQMAYALLDHPKLGNCRPSAMMAEILSLRFETSATDSLFLALFLCRLPASIRDDLAAANHETATFSGTPGMRRWSLHCPNHSPPCRFAPLRLKTATLQTAAPSLLAPAPDHPITAATAATAAPTPGRQESRATSAGNRICRNHRKFGAKAWNCQGNCDFAEN